MDLNVYIIVHFLLGVISIFLGFSVFLKNRSRSINRIFALLTFSVAFWSICYSIWLMMGNQQSALFWSRLLNLGATFIPVFALHWILLLLRKKKRNILLFFYFVTFIFALCSFSDFYISSTKSVLQFPYWPQMNWLYVLFLIAGWGCMILYGYLLLIKELKHATGFYKEQIKFVLFGLIVGYLGGSTNYPLMVGLDWFPPIGSPFVIAFPVVFGYAMVKHRLMDVKFVLRKYSVYAASLISIIFPAVVIKLLVYTYFTKTALWPDFLILISAISVFPPIKNYYYHIANKYFFSSLYDAREVIADLSHKLSSTLEVDKIYKYISDTLINSFHAQAVGILTYNEKENVYTVRYNKGFETGKQKNFFINESLHTSFIQPNNVLIVEEIKEQYYAKHKKIIDLLANFGVEIVVPLNLKDKTIGLIVLSAKESKDIYNEEDLGVLDIIGDQAAIALENALLYEETKNFGKKLEKEVIKATKELRVANKKLKQLDMAKSEFISIASHQLRTPLSIIKGYISMTLEGTYGKLTKEKREILEKVYVSNERLIQLVENLLNISRIEAGKLQFIFAKTQINDIIISVMDELKSAAVKKGLELKYQEPAKPLPEVKADGEKIRQVIINLVDNAIKYTGSGDVTVCLERIDDEIQFSVADSGIGIRKEDLADLFKKFSRGGKTPLVHPEGIGLGLYVAQTMIKAHHGRIWAESKGEDKGTTFCFALPVK